MFNWNGLRLRKKAKETAQSTENEMKNKSAEEKETVQKTGTGSLKSLLKTAVKDAEQIAESVKAKAQEEANGEANEIRSKAKMEVEEIISAAKAQAESIESEAKDRALQFPVIAQENIDKEADNLDSPPDRKFTSLLQDLVDKGQEIGLDLNELADKINEDFRTKLEESETTVAEEPGGVEEVVEVEKPAEVSGDAQGKEEEIGAEPFSTAEETGVEEIEEKEVEETPQQKEEGMGEEREITEPGDEEVNASEQVESEKEAVLENVQTPVDYNKNAVYSGDVELTITPPIELKLVTKLYNHLQTVPDLRILYTKGSWDQSTTITIVLEKPLPLIGIISEITGMEVIPEFIEGERDAKSKPAALFGGEGVVKKIKLTLKEK